jgi:polysaccharide export outer membrane protein
VEPGRVAVSGAGIRGTLILAAVLCAGLGAFSARAASIGSRDYILGPRDLIEIQVYEQKDLVQVVRLSEEGRINLTLVGEVMAGGLTVNELIKVLTGKYREYIYEPQVSVFIREYAPKEVYVLGEVKRPGLVRITGAPTLLELLSEAGGVADSGGDTLTVIRKPLKGKEPETIAINLGRLLSQGKRELNIEILDGDTVYVPRADYFFVFGEVARPGSYKLEKDMKLTVLKAISLAGGFTDKAAKGKIKITREENDQQTTFGVDLSAEVRAQDIVIVPESFF